MANLKEKITQEFISRFEEEPTYIVRAPGRVNLIGEHTDYNDGFVLPMAIDRAMWIALRPREERRVILQSLDFPQPTDFSLDNITHGESWDEYIRGMAWSLQNHGFELGGWEGVLASDIPVGAGLSSSAALEMVTAMVFSMIGGWEFQPETMARLGQRTENEWVGANTGIMDQMISAAGKEGFALLIDCRDLSTSLVQMPSNMVVVIMDTGTRHAHTDSGYNERREQCEYSAKFFNVSHLRDVSLDAFTLRAEELDELHRRRARHVITENARTRQAADALNKGDAIKFGQLMNESHISMRDDFEITNTELNIMVEIAQKQPGCYGARMTGGGFGGCAIALVEHSTATAFAQQVAVEYETITNIKPNLYICQPSNGAEVINN